MSEPMTTTDSEQHECSKGRAPARRRVGEGVRLNVRRALFSSRYGAESAGS